MKIVRNDSCKNWQKTEEERKTLNVNLSGTYNTNKTICKFAPELKIRSNETDFQLCKYGRKEEEEKIWKNSPHYMIQNLLLIFDKKSC